MIAQCPQWQSICDQKPIRLAGVSFQKRMVRGEVWTFAHNDVSGQHLRVNRLVSSVLERLDGETTIATLLASDEDKLATDELEALASTLLTLSHYNVIGLSDEAEEDRQQRRIKQLSGQKTINWANPLSIRFPMHDPDRWLSRLYGLMAPCLNKALLYSVLAFLLSGVIALMMQWEQVVQHLKFVSETPQQWWQMLIIYPVLKCFHELAHALSIKRFGGNVHEVGISLLVLMPVPYVDASDSWRFCQRSKRILVSAAGMLAECFFATLGFFVWLLVEPGLLSNLGFVVALIGSFSTLLFNANPLLKFDGYQILQDTLDMPNLAARSARYLRYLGRRYVLKVGGAQSPATGNGERRWLFAYGVLAGCYRWVITLGIAIYLTTHFPLLGACLALFAMYQLSLKPIVRLVKYLSHDVELNGRRFAASCITGLTVSGLVLAFAVLPLPTSTRAEGIVELSKQAQLFSPQSGEVIELFSKSGDIVIPGDAILRLSEPELTTRMNVMESELLKLRVKYHAALVNETEGAASLREDMKKLELDLAVLSDRVENLTIYATVEGTLSLQPGINRLGHYVNAGDSVGHVVNRDALRVKAVVREKDIARVEEGVNEVRIRLAERTSEQISGELSQITPAGTNNLPSPALAYNGYSGIAVASNQQHQLKTVEPVFHLEISLPKHVAATGIGGRAFITLAHQPESMGQRTWRSLRQMLLNQLAI